jgi:hypothetical protein
MHDEQGAWTSSMDMLRDYQHEQHRGHAAWSHDMQHSHAKYEIYNVFEATLP